MTPRRQLLQRAAKAAGYATTWKTGHCKGGAFEGAFLDGQPWRPLDDDGDALRLAVRLRIKFRYNEALGQALAWPMGAKEAGALTANIEDCGRDECATTRLAIVRAAAALADER